MIWGYTELSAYCALKCDRSFIRFTRSSQHLRPLITLLSENDLLKLGPIKGSVFASRAAIRAACSFVLGNLEQVRLAVRYLRKDRCDTYGRSNAKSLREIPILYNALQAFVFSNDARSFREKVQAASDLSIANANFLAARHSSKTVELVVAKFAADDFDLTDELSQDYEAMLSFDEALTYHEFRTLRPLWTLTTPPSFDEWKFDLQ